MAKKTTIPKKTIDDLKEMALWLLKEKKNHSRKYNSKTGDVVMIDNFNEYENLLYCCTSYVDCVLFANWDDSENEWTFTLFEEVKTE